METCDRRAGEPVGKKLDREFADRICKREKEHGSKEKDGNQNTVLAF